MDARFDDAEDDTTKPVFPVKTEFVSNSQLNS